MESNILTHGGIKWNQIKTNDTWRNQMESNILTHGGIKWNQIF